MEPLMRHVQSRGTLLGAYAQGELIGVLGMMKPGCCRPSGWAALRFAAVVAARNPPIGVWRIAQWLAAWARHDPSELHWHIGPLAVAPAYRRQGVGRHLMLHCCRQLDSLAAVAWLETDLAINARFYESLGFATVRQEPVLGIPNSEGSMSRSLLNAHAHFASFHFALPKRSSPISSLGSGRLNR